MEMSIYSWKQVLDASQATPQLLNSSRNLTIAPWLIGMKNCHSAVLPLTLHNWNTGEAADLSMTVIADDVARTGFCSSEEDFYRQLELWEKSLNSHLGKLGIGQNRDKRKHLVGRISDFGHASKMVSDHFEYVGSIFSHSQSLRAEVQQRISKAKRAWMAMGSFWHSPAPLKFKIVCYRSLVQNTLLSGMEALVLGRKDFEEMEVLQMRWLRKIMSGKACS
eukprot:TRINITY_DN25456_c0_g1_i1.p1 TRINITY_DN25456_c0_g1~~TRINITY_DN25456_c0_g1_i1.p1  ORF type:complete len:221 (-),score=23.05 TRINITY_DN25456_c0_g1_i1:147-809(-)